MGGELTKATDKDEKTLAKAEPERLVAGGEHGGGLRMSTPRGGTGASKTGPKSRGA